MTFDEFKRDSCGGSIAPTLKKVMESIPEIVLSKDTSFEWNKQSEDRCHRADQSEKDIPTIRKLIRQTSHLDKIDRDVLNTIMSKKPLLAIHDEIVVVPDELFKVDGSVTAYFGCGKAVSNLEYKRGKKWAECPRAAVIYTNGEATYISAAKASEPTKDMFGNAVKRALTIEKSVADKAYDKFKEDERKHISKLKEVLIKLRETGKPATAYDLETSMVIMWELLQKGYVEDVTPAARTGGAVAPDTTYCYKVTSSGRVFIAGYEVSWGI